MNYSNKVIPVLRQVKDLLLPGFGQAAIINQKDNSAVNVVTKLDLQVEEFVSVELKKIYPTIGFVGEEFGGNRQAGRFWLMDPIDATGHFVRGLPFCTCMIALIEDGQVVFSAVYDFVRDLMYWAQKDQGAYCQQARLTVSSRDLSQAYISWESRLDNETDKQIFERLKKQTILLKTISAGWEFAMVAAGKLDARLCFNPYGKDYDFAAGSLLVREAGGVVNNLGSQTYDYSNVNFIAANQVIYKQLTQGPGKIW
ncbi:MAG: inositol monophosphatase family protein [Patescibacteria group bacterium]